MRLGSRSARQGAWQGSTAVCATAGVSGKVVTVQHPSICMLAMSACSRASFHAGQRGQTVHLPVTSCCSPFLLVIQGTRSIA